MEGWTFIIKSVLKEKIMLKKKLNIAIMSYLKCAEDALIYMVLSGFNIIVFNNLISRNLNYLARFNI